MPRLSRSIQVLDLLGSLRAALGERAHLAGHHREALALFAGASGLDRGISASMLVRNAISSITLMMSSILREEVLIDPITSTTCDTTEPPLIAASEAEAAS